MSKPREFKPGFRLSELDVAFMFAVFILSAFIARFFEALGIAALFSLLHFFLFCNVLRMQRWLELLWAATFVSLWSAAWFRGVPSWGWVYILAGAATIAVSSAQMLLPSYHGIFWRRVNPKLPAWWQKRYSSAS